jgi:tetratricopeptide (TPR) repeat protein
VKPLLIGLVSVVLSATAAFAASAAAPAPPATAAPVAAPAGTPPVRYDWQGNHKKAQAALNSKDYKTAIKLFTEIIESGRLPKTWVAPTYYFRGKAYRSSHQYDLALADYQKAVEADPKMDVAYYEMAATYQAKENHKKAVEAFSQAIAIKGNADYYYGRCVSHSWLGNQGAAIDDCEAAVRLHPTADLLGTLGRMYEDAGQKQRAIDTYRRALAINPNQPEAVDGLKHLTK